MVPQTGLYALLDVYSNTSAYLYDNKRKKMTPLEKCELRIVKLKEENREIYHTMRKLRVQVDSFPEDVRTLSEAVQVMNEQTKVIADLRYRLTLAVEEKEHFGRLLTFFTSVDKSEIEHPTVV